MGDAIRFEDDGAVRHLVLCRAEEFNTITPALRDELDAALDAADRDPGVKVVLVRAEGRAFCAGLWPRLVHGLPARRRRRPTRGSGTRLPTSR